MDKIALLALKKSGAVDVGIAVSAKEAAEAAQEAAETAQGKAEDAAEELEQTVEDVAELQTDVSNLKSQLSEIAVQHIVNLANTPVHGYYLAGSGSALKSKVNNDAFGYLIAVEPNTTYSIIYDLGESTFFRYATFTYSVAQMQTYYANNNEIAISGDVYGTNSTNDHATFTTGANDHSIVICSQTATAPTSTQFLRGEYSTAQDTSFHPAPTFSVYDKADTYAKSEVYAKAETYSTAEVDALVDDLEGAIFETVPAPTAITALPNVITKTGYSAKPASNNLSVLLETNASYDTYACVLTEDADIYVDLDEISAAYLAVTYGQNYTETVEDENYYYLMCSNPARVRKSESNLPTVENKLSLHAGDVFAVTITAGYTANLYGIASDVIRVKQSFKDQILPKKRYFKYFGTAGEDNSTEYLYVYLPAMTGYTRYSFVHTVRADKNSDIWRVGSAAIVDDAFSYVKNVTVSGEWECAVKLKNRDDFSGGNLHGNELLDSITFFVDGQPVTISDYTDYTEFDELRIVETSNLYDNADSTVLIAYHGSEHIFTDKLEIGQSLKWAISEVCTAAYLAMYPCAKSASAYLYLNNAFEPEQLPQVIESNDVTSCALYSATAKLFTIFSINAYPKTVGTPSNSFLCTDNNGNNYNKCYYSTVRNGNYTTTVGETWMMRSEYHVFHKA